MRSMASAYLCRRTWCVLAGLCGNELIDVVVGEHAARALGAVAGQHILERAAIDVALESLDRAIELGRGLGHGLEPIGNGRWDRLAPAQPLPDPQPSIFDDVVGVEQTQCHHLAVALGVPRPHAACPPGSGSAAFRLTVM